MPTDNTNPPETWGAWAFEAPRLALVLRQNGATLHSILLAGITSSACMLDAIFEVKEKEWATDEVVASLITALQDLFDPRVTLCGKQSKQTFDPVSHLKSAIH